MNPSKLFILAALVVIGVFVLSGPAHVLDEIDNALFGLESNDTVHSYLNAPSSRRMRFDLGLCRNGRCLPQKAWNCGFTLSNFYSVEQCFDNTVGRVNPLTRVGDVRMSCGLRYAEVDRSPYTRRTLEDCRWFGGTWGVLPQIPLFFTR
jgi:hypothetical protein